MHKCHRRKVLVIGGVSVKATTFSLVNPFSSHSLQTLCEQILGETIADMVALPCISSSEVSDSLLRPPQLQARPRGIDEDH